MKALYNTLLYQPILKALVFIYGSVALGDFGVAVIILTLLVRVVLFPLFYKGAKQQVLLQKIHPRIKDIQARHKDDKERQARELMELYKKHNINPFSQILSLLIQLPIVIALYQVILHEISGTLFDNFIFLGFIDVREKSLVLTALAALLQYVQMEIALPKQKKGDANPAAGAGKVMKYVAPGLTLLILSSLPAVLSLYVLTSTLFGIGQQLYIKKSIKKEEEIKEEAQVKEELKEIHEETKEMSKKHE